MPEESTDKPDFKLIPEDVLRRFKKLFSTVVTEIDDVHDAIVEEYSPQPGVTEKIPKVDISSVSTLNAVDPQNNVPSYKDDVIIPEGTKVTELLKNIEKKLTDIH